MGRKFLATHHPDRRERARSIFDDHAPSLGDIVIVDLEQHLIVYRGAEQLGALRGAQ